MKWLKEVGAWFKKNWQWVLFPIGILMVLGRVFMSRKTTEVVSSELSGAAEAEREINQVAEAKAEQAKVERDVAVEDINQNHQRDVQVLTDQQKERVSELRKKPEELNKYLLEVGKQVRGDKQD